jgi:YVTN family beta-propeller protein
MKKRGFVFGCIVVLMCGCQFTITAAPPMAYSIINHFAVGGEGGWDFCALDDATGRLFISHETQVQVVDVSTGKQIGAISDTKGVHGIAFAPEVNKAYISNGKDTSVSVIDLKSLVLIKKVHVTGTGPDAIVYESFSHSMVVFNGKSDNATVIDVKTDKVTATIALEGKPESAASDGAGLLYDNYEDKNQVAVINMKSMKVEKKWPVAPGEAPSAMAIDNQNHRLFIGCGNKMMVVMDAINGKVITSLPIGDHVDAACFDSSTGLIFFSNGEGNITVIESEKKDDYEVAQTVMTQKGAKTIAMSAKTHHLYLPAAEYNAAPAPTTENPKPKAKVKPGTFVILDVAPAAGK